MALASAALTETCCTKDSDGSIANSGSEEEIGLLVAFMEEVAKRQSPACAEDMRAILDGTSGNDGGIGPADGDKGTSDGSSDKKCLSAVVEVFGPAAGDGGMAQWHRQVLDALARRALMEVFLALHMVLKGAIGTTSSARAM